mmetsp:Transcript_29740/g.88951  ORF Transcript_29740/g.88951 Transcript_29740/m.88951 type:complete len:564 (-) Transcript_29740:45-1736(-)
MQHAPRSSGGARTRSNTLRKPATGRRIAFRATHANRSFSSLPQSYGCPSEDVWSISWQTSTFRCFDESHFETIFARSPRCNNTSGPSSARTRVSSTSHLRNRSSSRLAKRGDDASATTTSDARSANGRTVAVGGTTRLMPFAFQAAAAAASAAPGFFDLCAYCNEQIQDAAECAVASCKHTFHRDCAAAMCEKASEAGEAPECPTCFQPLTLQVSRVHGVAEDEDDAGAKPRKKPAAAPRKKKVKQAQSTIDKGLVTLGLKKGRLDPVPDLAASDASDDEGAEERLDALPETAAAGDERRRDAATRDVCVVCLDAPRDTMLFNCGHVCACAACVAALQARKEPCPLCRAPIKRVARVDGAGKGSRLGRASILQKIDLQRWRTSTKVEACFEAVQKDRKEAHKVIVFSQYRTMLDIMEWRLRLGGQRVAKLTGDMPLAERKSVLHRFKTDESVGVILLSLKAGGEGLNLQEASRVYLLEPWWNPAVEMQAIQRAHRIGQTKAVKATRFVCKGIPDKRNPEGVTIEKKMFMLQEKKRLVFEGTVDGSAASFSKLTLEDLTFLFTR